MQTACARCGGKLHDPYARVCAYCKELEVACCRFEYICGMILLLTFLCVYFATDPVTLTHEQATASG